MTDTERYEQVIYNLTELLKSKNLDICIYRKRIKDLEKQLEQTEKSLANKDELIRKYGKGEAE